MYRLEKNSLERNGSRKSLRQRKVLSVASYQLTTALLARNGRRKTQAYSGVNDQSKCEAKTAARTGGGDPTGQKAVHDAA